MATSSTSDRIDRIVCTEEQCKYFRDAMTDFNKRYKDFPLYLSGGVDSTTILFSLLENGYKPKCFTFHLSGEISRDQLIAQSLCDKFGVDLVNIEIPKTNETIVSDVLRIHKLLDTSRTTHIQCLQPFLYTIPTLLESGFSKILAGFAGDDMAGKNRWHRFTYKKLYLYSNPETQKRLDLESIENRRESFENRIGADKKIIELHNMNGIAVMDPFFENKELAEFVFKIPFYDLSVPYEKGIYIKAYRDYWEKSEIFPKSSSLQHEGGIRDWHNKLLDSEYNIKEYKVINKIYEEIIRRNSGKGLKNFIE